MNYNAIIMEAKREWEQAYINGDQQGMEQDAENILTANDIFCKFDDLRSMKQEVASYNIANLTYDEFIETVKKQGFNFLEQDSTNTITDELTSYIHSLEYALRHSKELLTLIIDSSAEHDTSAQREAKQKILKKYNEYLNTLG